MSPEPSPRSSARPLSTGGHVVLGLLMDGPATGWDLARVADRSIAHFWPVTRAHIYAELPKLAARGLATATEVPQVGAPDRRVYEVTEAGREAFARWLAEVDLTEERGRQPLQLQLFFAAYADTGRLTGLLDAWRERATAAEAHCADILRRRGVAVDDLPPLALSSDAGAGADERSARLLAGLDARAMTALFGLRRAQADLVWLGEVQRSLLEPPQ
ncbi:PadR family transcriptional regulator [Nocardioides rubriscoriae]|uniref:PadR family transcriptional regulator n=1 Tax=Nocardioides rubriscoriae TaxID=642762 RepID=UPI0014789536|nr:PadR family transcriptional regulator [Nocardioides rubriscoriae]